MLVLFYVSMSLVCLDVDMSVSFVCLFVYIFYMFVLLYLMFVVYIFVSLYGLSPFRTMRD